MNQANPYGEIARRHSNEILKENSKVKAVIIIIDDGTGVACAADGPHLHLIESTFPIAQKTLKAVAEQTKLALDQNLRNELERSNEQKIEDGLSNVTKLSPKGQA